MRLHNSAHLGCTTELRISADLLSRGWQIFRALSPSATCDLIGISPTGKLVRIEVTKAHRTLLGKLKFLPHKKHNYDLICGTDQAGELVYERSPEEFA